MDEVDDEEDRIDEDELEVVVIEDDEVEMELELEETFKEVADMLRR